MPIWDVIVAGQHGEWGLTNHVDRTPQLVVCRLRGNMLNLELTNDDGGGCITRCGVVSQQTSTLVPPFNANTRHSGTCCIVNWTGVLHNSMVVCWCVSAGRCQTSGHTEMLWCDMFPNWSRTDTEYGMQLQLVICMVQHNRVYMNVHIDCLLGVGVVVCVY